MTFVFYTHFAELSVFNQSSVGLELVEYKTIADTMHKWTLPTDLMHSLVIERNKIMRSVQPKVSL